MPVRIDGDKQSVAPRPRIVIAAESEKLHLLGVAAVEAIRSRQREIQIARFAGIDRGIVGRAVEMNRRRLLVVAVDQKQRGRVRHGPQEVALVDVELRDRIGVQVAAIVQRIDIEVVAQRDVEVRPVLADVFQIAHIQIRTVHLALPFGMRVALHAKRESAAWRALCMKRVFRSRTRRAQTIVIARDSAASDPVRIRPACRREPYSPPFSRCSFRLGRRTRCMRPSHPEKARSP